jgi:CheY-like chemotaxis protein/predicted regulator of Ras-like GTPase activity (Roadblock/LC7/MglB family)
MSDVWRILVVEGDEALNHNVINSLRKDGYIVQGVTNGADAVRILWAEEYDVVLCDLKTPGTDGFELLQWLRAAHPSTRMILLGGSDPSALRMQALESGAAGYLEKPLDMHLLKEELRRLLQQTGFSANLESFDLLDVIQIISMSRKSIALLVNTGLEERGLLCFKSGDLVWAEYGLLRGEEAFFALAAHKNGTVTHQSWNEQVVSNVTQPLSRLIFQALQYRSKYAQPFSGEHRPIATGVQPSGALAPVVSNGSGAFAFANEDDTPFGMVAEPVNGQAAPFAVPSGVAMTESEKEWWERTGSIPRLGNGIDIASIGVPGNMARANAAGAPLPASAQGVPSPAIDGLTSGTITPATVYKTPASQRTDLPSWLTDQPTASDLPRLRPASDAIPATPRRTSSPEWTPPPASDSSDQDATDARKSVQPPRKQPSGAQRPVSTDTGARRTASPEWQPPESMSPTPTRANGHSQTFSPLSASGPLVPANGQNSSLTGTARALKSNYNYSALVTALQTLGYSIAGFIAAAVVGMDGQPVAQVAVDDLDISRLCKYFSEVLRNTLQALNQGMWGDYEEMVITSSDRYILLRVIGAERNAFHVLITTRATDATESMQVMSNVEAAISAALHP